MNGESPTEQWTVCTCNHCSGHLELDAARAGETVQCPRCGSETVLFIPEVRIESAPPLRKRFASAPLKPASPPATSAAAAPAVYTCRQTHIQV
jgi:hypothetical protein